MTREASITDQQTLELINQLAEREAKRFLAIQKVIDNVITDFQHFNEFASLDEIRIKVDNLYYDLVERVHRILDELEAQNEQSARDFLIEVEAHKMIQIICDLPLQYLEMHMKLRCAELILLASQRIK